MSHGKVTEEQFIFLSFLPGPWQRSGDVMAAQGSQPEYPAGCHMHPGVCPSVTHLPLLSGCALGVERAVGEGCL